MRERKRFVRKRMKRLRRAERKRLVREKKGIIIINSPMYDPFSLCLFVFQSFTLCSLELQSVIHPLPTLPSYVRKTHFYSKPEHNTDKNTNPLFFSS